MENGRSVDDDDRGRFADLRNATKKSDNHFEVPDIFFPLREDGSINFDAPEAVNDLIKSNLDQDTDQRIKDTLEYKKSLPLKERREFNVCNIPIGNVVDGFQYNEIDGTKKSDILLGTSAADDIKGKNGGDVIQAKDDDDIVHTVEKATIPFKLALTTTTSMQMMEMTPYSQDQMMTMKMVVKGTMNYMHRMETTC